MTFRLGRNGSRDLRMIGLIFLVALMTRTILLFCPELTQLGVLIRLIVSQIIWTLNSRDSIADFGIGLLKALMLLLGLGGENNYVCWPICLILRLLFYQRNCKLQGFSLSLCGIPPLFGQWFAQMEVGSFRHLKGLKRFFLAVSIVCLETKTWTSGWLLCESNSIVRYLLFFSALYF